MISMLLSILRVRPEGTVSFGVPCGPHVWVAQGSTGKSKENPRGNPDRNYACFKGNLVATRAAVCICLTMARGCLWFIEQPGSSVMPYLKCMRHILSISGLLKLHPYRSFAQRLWLVRILYLEYAQLPICI